MYTQLLPFLRCPACHERLVLAPYEIAEDGEIIGAALRCAGCGARYEVRDGIADFLGAPRPPTPAQWVNETRLAAWAYERLWRPFALTLLSGERFPYRRELPLVAELSAPERGGLYVDLACSNGLYARALTRAMRGASGHAVGVDHSLPMLRDAQRRARAAGLRISYVRAEAQTLPLAAGAAAGIAIGGSLNEIGDLGACLSEVRRVLGDQGRFVAMTLVRAQTAAGCAVQTLLAPGGVTFWSPSELVQQFQTHRLRTTGAWRYGIVLFTASTTDNRARTTSQKVDC